MSLSDRLNGLRWRRQAMRRLWRPGAQPHDTFLPPAPLPNWTAGLLDHPGPGYEYEDGMVGFNGWVAFESGAPVARVEGLLDGVPIGRARTGMPRADVEKQRDLPLAHLSGFELSAAIPAVLPEGERVGAKELLVIATSVEGERFEIGPVPVFLRPAPEPEREEAAPPDPQPSAPAPGPGGSGPRVAVFTHQLTLGGAQLYLLDLIRELHRRGADLAVVTLVDGPLRDDLEEIGVAVHLTSMGAHERLGPHVGRVGELAAWAAPGKFEVALVNTATSGASFGAEAAAALGIPAVWAIHESFPPAILWADLEPEVRGRTEATIGEAAFAVFEADATRRMYEGLVPPERCLTIPYGVDVEPIERERGRLDLAAARRRAGIGVEEEVVLCVGTVEPRKAQVQLAQAFGLVAARHPSARLVFVGGRKDSFTEDLEEVIEGSSARERIELIPIIPDVQTWYGIADVLVCASDVESLPRTVLEAMLWGTPVLATDVFGLPELIDDGRTGWLFESRDLKAMADGLDRALSASAEERQRIAAAARELVEERHSQARYGERIEELLRRAARDAR